MARAVRFAVLASFVYVGVATAAACSSFSDGSPEPTTAEAGPDEASAADAPPAIDASALDAPIVPDEGGPADGGTLCFGSSHWLCDDFDPHALGVPSVAWAVDVAGAGTMVVEPFGLAKSLPNVATSRAGAAERGRFNLTHAAPSNQIACDLDMFVETRGDGESILFDVALYADSFYYHLELHGGGGGTDTIIHYGAFEGGVSSSAPTAVMLPSSAWRHVHLELRGGASPQIIAKLPDGVVQGAINGGAGLPPASSQAVAFGGFTLGPGATGWVVHYDNVVCDH
jgi:hypothetical protein